MTINIEEIADKADMIVNGYAFTKDNNFIRVLNLNDLDKAALLSIDGEMQETTMDDIELAIAQKYYRRNQLLIA
ncbi:MAG: hypothetical protein MJZ66_04690 [Bacteroidales bacterium]|nr:hypothetical protein [Bacteroidales bacterium]